MNLLSENPTSFRGMLGMSLEVRIAEVPGEIPQQFLDLVAPFMAKCGDEDAFDVSLLSHVAHPLGVYINFHGHLVNNRLLRFRVKILRKPESDAPTDVHKSSDQLGGYPHGMYKLLGFLSGREVQCRAEMEGFILDTKKWPLSFPKPRKRPNLPGLKWNHETVAFKSDTERVELMFLKSGSISFEVSSRFNLTMGEKCIEDCSEAIWQTLKPIFKNG